MHIRFLFFLSVFLPGLLLFSLGLQAQIFPREAGTGKVVFAEEVLVMDGPKTDLYRRARAWLLQNSHSPRALLVDEEADGVLIAHSFALIQAGVKGQPRPYKLWYTLKIEVENDRYWYRCYDLKVEDAAPRSARARESQGQALEKFLPAPAQKGKQPSLGTCSLPAQAHACVTALLQDLKKRMR